jgi:hypothetical protein
MIVRGADVRGIGMMTSHPAPRVEVHQGDALPEWKGEK